MENVTDHLRCVGCTEPLLLEKILNLLDIICEAKGCLVRAGMGLRSLQALRDIVEVQTLTD